MPAPAPAARPTPAFAAPRPASLPFGLADGRVRPGAVHGGGTPAPAHAGLHRGGHRHDRPSYVRPYPAWGFAPAPAPVPVMPVTVINVFGYGAAPEPCACAPLHTFPPPAPEPVFLPVPYPGYAGLPQAPAPVELPGAFPGEWPSQLPLEQPFEGPAAPLPEPLPEPAPAPSEGPGEAAPEAQPQAPGAEAPDPARDAAFRSAFEAFRRADYAAALAGFEALTTADPRFGEGWMAVAHCAFALGRYPVAARAVREAAALGAFPRGYRFDPAPLYPTPDAFAGLLAALEAHVAAGSADVDAQLVLAWLGTSLGRRTQAQDLLQRVLTLRPDDPAAPVLALALLPAAPPAPASGAAPSPAGVPAPADAGR